MVDWAYKSSSFFHRIFASTASVLSTFLLFGTFVFSVSDTRLGILPGTFVVSVLYIAPFVLSVFNTGDIFLGGLC